MQVTLDEFIAQHLESKLDAMFQRAYDQGVADARKKYEVKPLMTRRQFMEFANISEAKCAQLFNRQDFPVNREFGHPRVPRELLFEWIERNTDWVEANMPNFKYSTRKASV